MLLVKMFVNCLILLQELWLKSKELRLKTQNVPSLASFHKFCLRFACFDVTSLGASTPNFLSERKEQTDRLTGYLLAPS